MGQARIQTEMVWRNLHLGVRLSSMLTAIKNDPTAWCGGYEGNTTFGVDFGSPSIVIGFLRRSH